MVFDTSISAMLQSQYPKVVYARNITDIDDKIMKTAAELGEDIYRAVPALRPGLF